MTPKSLLRLPACVSAVEQLTAGRFDPVVDDPRAEANRSINRLLVCSGKVYYDLDAFRQGQETADVAILRLEQFYPFPERRLREAIESYGTVEDVLWVQEEPENMGGWEFVRHQLARLLPAGTSLRYIGRPASASPATGSARRHATQRDRLLHAALVAAPG
jgi:2-oxoglutarate dehydrogenase E1 component